MKVTSSMEKLRRQDVNFIKKLSLVRSAGVQWSHEERGIVLRIPWEKAGFNLRHLRPLNAGTVVLSLRSLTKDIWLCCDGTRSVEQIWMELQARYPQTEISLEEIVRKVNQLLRRGWLVACKGE